MNFDPKEPPKQLKIFLQTNKGVPTREKQEFVKVKLYEDKVLAITPTHLLLYEIDDKRLLISDTLQDLKVIEYQNEELNDFDIVNRDSKYQIAIASDSQIYVYDLSNQEEKPKL